MPSRAEIAATVAQAFASSGDVIRDAIATRTTPGAYDPATGEPGAATTATSAGRALFDRKPNTKDQRFAGLEIGPSDEAIYLQGFATFAPALGHKLEIDAVSREIIFCEDVVQAGALWFVVAR